MSASSKFAVAIAMGELTDVKLSNIDTRENDENPLSGEG